MTNKINHQKILMLMILLTLFLLGGCAHTWSPGSFSPVPMESVGPLGHDLSVNLINAQNWTTPQIFYSLTWHSHQANYNVWTDFFIRYWSEELKKRGVAVGSQSRNTIYVKLDNFWLREIFFVYNSGMMIHLSSPDNSWKKDFSATEVTSTFRTIGGALDSVFQHAAENLMKDPEVLNRMKP